MIGNIPARTLTKELLTLDLKLIQYIILQNKTKPLINQPTKQKSTQESKLETSFPLLISLRKLYW